MPGVGSKHLTAVKIYGIGKGPFQEGVQGVFKVSNGACFSRVGHPEMLGVKEYPRSLQAELGCPWAAPEDGSLGAPSPAQVAEGLLTHQKF